MSPSMKMIRYSFRLKGHENESCNNVPFMESLRKVFFEIHINKFHSDSAFRYYRFFATSTMLAHSRLPWLRGHSNIVYSTFVRLCITQALCVNHQTQGRLNAAWHQCK